MTYDWLARLLNKNGSFVSIIWRSNKQGLFVRRDIVNLNSDLCIPCRFILRIKLKGDSEFDTKPSGLAISEWGRVDELGFKTNFSISMSPEWC